MKSGPVNILFRDSVQAKSTLISSREEREMTLLYGFIQDISPCQKPYTSALKAYNPGTRAGSREQSFTPATN
jgi:hypothetical protein